MEWEELFLLAPEPSIGFGVCHCAVRRGVICQSLRQIHDAAGLTGFARRKNLDGPFMAHRTQVNEKAVWHKDSSDFIQGMDHALMRNSSERPGKDGDIECLFVEGDVQCISAGKQNALCQIGWAVNVRRT